MTDCPANRQRAKMFVEYRGTRRNKMKSVKRTGTRRAVELANGVRTIIEKRDGRKRNVKQNRQDEARNGTGTTKMPKQERTTRRYNKTDGLETPVAQRTAKRYTTGTPGELRTAKRENDTEGTETSVGRRTTRRQIGIKRVCNEEETSEEAGK